MDRMWIFLLFTSTLAACGMSEAKSRIISNRSNDRFSRDINGGTPGSPGTWSYQVGGNQPANGLSINGGIPVSTGIKGGTPGSTGTWNVQFGGNQPANGLGINGGTPGSPGSWSYQVGGNQPANGLNINGGTSGSTGINGGTPGSPGSWSYQVGGNQPANGLTFKELKEKGRPPVLPLELEYFLGVPEVAPPADQLLARSATEAASSNTDPGSKHIAEQK